METLVVGAGPVGLTVALDLARRGRSVTVLNKRDYVAAGSKAICFAKRTLDIWNRLGVAGVMVGKGVNWDTGKVYWGARQDPVYQFDLSPVKHQEMPAFINLQQYHAEDALLAALEAMPNAEVRWGHETVGLEQDDAGVTVSVRCPRRNYRIHASWLVACDGCNSPVREMMGLVFDGRAFEDNFLIADIRMRDKRPAERCFWFDPPFNPGQSALLHQQPDDVWRLDFQLGSDIDRTACVDPAFVDPLIRGMLGEQVRFEPVWYSVYSFQCRRMERFVHGRVIFAGDSAHLVSPFGARGCNGGVADADNLAWKLDLVLKGDAPVTLLETYEHEATLAADENILQSTRSTDFMTPKTETSRAFRNAVLELAREHAFARPFVNSGRLSTAVSYPDSRLNGPDEPGADWQEGVAPGSPALDAPTGDGWLLEHLGGGFAVLSCGFSGLLPNGIEHLDSTRLGDPQGLVASRYDLVPGSAYLIRPDQYVAARWRDPATSQVEGALARAQGVSP